MRVVYLVLICILKVIQDIPIFGGVKVFAGDDKVIGGGEAPANSSPHIAHLDRISFFCSGSLITAQWVLSAAHCYFDPTSFTVVLGDHNQYVDEGTEQIITPSRALVHPQYNPTTKDNDIMLIKLSTPAELNQFVQPIALPLPYRELKAGTLCTVCGWGNSAMIGASYPDVLHCVNAPIIDQNTCNDPSSYAGRITDNMLCLGYPEGGKDACDGDSGGPSVCDGVLEGVVSWGYGCAYPGFPGVNAKVSWFVDWIQTTIAYN